MADLQFSIALSNNDRTRPIIRGEIKPDGINLVPSVMHPSEMFWRQLKFQEFDISEMSMSSLLIDLAAGDSHWVAIPVFTSRSFFHTAALVRTDRGIKEPADLKGKKMGVPEYQQTAALWSRGVLQHEFGVAPSDIEWWMERTPERSHGDARGAFQLSGELDGTILYLTDPNLVDRSRANVEDDPNIRPLFPDRVAEGARYYQKTGFYHINHAMVVRRSILEQHPWVALNVYHAMLKAKEGVNARARELADVYLRLGLLGPDGKKALAVDPFPYGVQANRKILDNITQYSFEQGLTPRKLSLEEVFAPATLDV
jgi:4,5-dihydroxyphthalate decarboxylase